MRKSAAAHEVRVAAQAAGVRLLYHISKLTLRVPLVFTKKHGIYAARLMLRLRLVFANRTYYTMMPRSGLNKTAFTAVLQGSMFSKPCAPAQGRVPCTRAAAQAAALRLLYHDAATQPQQNRTCCGFAWFNVLKSMRESASAHEERAAAQAAGLRLLYHGAAKRSQQNRACRGFAWFNVLKAHVRKRISA